MSQVDEAYTLGASDAFLQYGLKEANARLLGALAGAGMGAMAAPDGEGIQGAMLGGLGGYGLGAGASRAFQGAKELAIRGHEALMPNLNPTARQVRQAHRGSAPNKMQKVATADLRAFMSQLKGFTTPVDKLKHVTTHLNNPQFVQAVQSSPNGAAALKQLYAMANQGARPSVGGVKTTVQGAPAPQAPRPAVPPVVGVKIADVGWGFRVPSTPLSFNFGSKSERMPGMSRWVPREVIERAYAGLDQGLDPQAIMELEQERGNLLHPAVGAGLAGMLTHFNLPKPSLSSTLISAAGGGALGSLFNRATAQHRGHDAREALRGIGHERHQMFGEQRKRSTASESTPMIVARSGQ